MSDKTLIWVGNNDPKVAQSIASTIGEVMDTSEIDIIHSKRDNKSMMEVMREVDPNFFQKNVRHTYQDLYFEGVKKLDTIKLIAQHAIDPADAVEAIQNCFNPKLDVVATYNPNWLHISTKNNEEYADQKSNAICMLELVAAVSGEQNKQVLVDSVVNYLETGIKPAVAIVAGDEPVMHLMPINGELQHVEKVE